jgi:hypothetical protein
MCLTQKQEIPMATKSKKTTKAKKATNGSGKAKSEQIAALLRRAKGCTRADVLALTGWGAVSMQAQAKAAGVKLKIDKTVRPFRYKKPKFSPLLKRKLPPTRRVFFHSIGDDLGARQEAVKGG